jgi:hypothetical protein
MAELLTMYYISIIRYLAVLYWVWCSYHSYVKKTFSIRILWHHNGPFGLSSRHYFYFFRGTRPSFSGPMCYPCLFKMLGFDRSCASLSFPIGWSNYSSWCDGTCKDQYVSLPGRNMTYLCEVTWGCPISCLAFWKFSNVILFSNAVFFDGVTTWTRIYF